MIKVEASTFNPIDRSFMLGTRLQRKLPALCGMEGTGRVVEAKGESLQTWVGKRVSFVTFNGAWCQFAVTNPETTF